MKSIVHHILLLVLRIKGIKKIFLEDPINYKKLRNDDQLQAPRSIGRKFQSKTFEIEQSKITEIKSKSPNNKIILFLPGGAFISGPVAHHWMTCSKLVRQSNSTVWLVNYPKAPETKIDKICKNIDSIYSSITKQYKDHKIVLVGDSAGANLCLTLAQRLSKQNIKKPSLLVLVSPVMDASMSNPEIKEVDKVDPMLNSIGVLSANRMCAVDENLNDPRMSPLNASFVGLPKTLFFAAEHDVTFPDQQKAIQKMQDENVELDAHIGKEMIHVWPFLPGLPEGKVAMDAIIESIDNIS